ncbi:MAG: alkaline phosphatase family protein [Luteimonas sp.]|nr:alkaline phosphatase family protein [Luteimonas sp.]
MLGAPGPNHLTVWGPRKRRVRGAAGSRDRSRVPPHRADRDCCRIAQRRLLRDAARRSAAARYAVLVSIALRRPAGPLPVHPASRTHRARRRRRIPHCVRPCCRIQYDPDQRIWNTVRALEPDMFLWLGDNIYADSDQPAAITDLYARGRVVPSLEPLLRSVPQLATWDDHDFGYNDSDGRSPYKAESLRLFKRFWANPSYGESDNPGVYCKQHYGGVDFFILDGRYHRDRTDAPDGADKTMLGARQKAWLKRELKASTTPFKILAIGGGWSSAENEKGGDSWAVYMAERNELFDFIRDEGIAGVVCISGDSHMGELNCIPRSAQGGYDIYDFCSSPLAQMPAAKHTRQVPEVRVRDVWHPHRQRGLDALRPDRRHADAVVHATR